MVRVKQFTPGVSLHLVLTHAGLITLLLLNMVMRLPSLA